MGWKSVKDHYKIEHIVQVVENGEIQIGSIYIPDLIVISPQGVMIKSCKTGNADLCRIESEMSKNPELLEELVQKKDIFEISIPIYTYDGGEIFQKHCEKLGWPHVTHDGHLINENNFSENKNEVIQWAFESTEAAIKIYIEQIEEAKKKLKEKEDNIFLHEANKDLEKLKAAYPDYKEQKEITQIDSEKLFVEIENSNNIRKEIDVYDKVTFNEVIPVENGVEAAMHKSKLRLNDISKLSSGWRNGKGHGTVASTVAMALKFINKRPSITPNLKFYPNDKGGVVAEIEQGGWDISVEFLPEGSIEMYGFEIDGENDFDPINFASMSDDFFARFDKQIGLK